MHFELDKTQKQIQKAVKDFVNGELGRESIEPLLSNGFFPEAIWKKAGELGLLGIHYPEKYSGQGLGMFETALVVEILCRRDSTVGICLARAGQGAELILRYGNEIQKGTWLSGIAEARVLSCPAFTEPGLGSDIARSRTTAIEDGDKWIIDGTKTFVINSGPSSGFYIVLCRTGNKSSSDEQSMSTILVEADCPGIEAKDIGPRIGGALLPIQQVYFNHVRVPLDNLIGKKHRGLHQVVAYYNESRIQAAAQSVGIASGAFDRALQWVKQREQFGRKIVDFQITRQKIADMAAKIETAKIMLYQSAWYQDNGKGTSYRSAMAKSLASRIAVEVCDEAVQLLGGYGYIQDYEVERYYRDALMINTLDGTQIRQKDDMAEELIKKRML